jgi:hypothetical protein
VITSLLIENLQITEPSGAIIPATIQNGTINISSCYPKDFDCDCDVDIIDVTMAAYAYGTSVGDPNYDPSFDMDSDGDVDIIDITMVTYDYGWTCGKSSLSRADYSGSNEEVQINWSQARLQDGFYELDLMIENVSQLGAYEFSFSYDPGVIEMLAIDKGKFLQSSNRKVQLVSSEINSDEGIVSMAVASLGAQILGADGTGVLATIKFEISNLSHLEIELINSQLVKPNANVIDHEFKSLESAIEVASILSVYPSPMVDFVNIEYQSHAKSNISFEIHNVFGAIVHKTSELNTSAGVHHLLLDHINLSSGMYVVSMKQNGKIIDSKRIIVQ